MKERWGGMKRFSAPPLLRSLSGQQQSAGCGDSPYLSSSTSSSSSSSSSCHDNAMVLVHSPQHHHHHPTSKHHHPHFFRHQGGSYQHQQQHHHHNQHHHHPHRPKPQQGDQQHQRKSHHQQRLYEQQQQQQQQQQQLQSQNEYHQQLEEQAAMVQQQQQQHLQHQPQPLYQHVQKQAKVLHLHQLNRQHQLRGRPESSPDARVKTEQTFESLFEQETLSDVTIQVNEDEYVFHAHRVVLELKSKLFASLLARHDNQPDIQVTATQGRARVPVLHVQEDAECGKVFSRFLYFLYSGAVWLHQDYVLPLFRLAHRYGVVSLHEHCQAYILQVLAKSCHSPSSFSLSSSSSSSSSSSHRPDTTEDEDDCGPISHNHSPVDVDVRLLASSPNGSSPPYVGKGFGLDAVCDLYEDDVYEGDVRQTAFRLLCCQFRRLVRSERWLACSVDTVCSLISGDNCNVEENLILVSATDYMKRKQLADKKQIEDILSLIRYPRLHRRVLYHLQKNGSFRNFPRIQELMLRAMMYHSFKDLPEAKDDFVGTQFRPRMSNNGSPNRRASMQVATVADYYFDEDPVISESAYSLDPDSPVTLITTRQSQV